MKKILTCIVLPGSKVVCAAISKVLGALELCEITDDPKKATLVIVDNYSAIGNFYSKEKWFAIIPLTGDKLKKELPENVSYLSFSNAIVEIMEIISKINDEKPTDAEVAEEPDVIEEFLPNAKKILVIEDTLRHQKSARLLLKGHRLTVATGYDEAMELLGKEDFEIVLSDLYLPMSPKTLGTEAFEIGKLVNYGLLLSLEAARVGVNYIAVATDLNHHADCFSAAFDHFSQFDFRIEGAKVIYLHAPMTHIDGEKESVKDWLDVMNQLLI